MLRTSLLGKSIDTIGLHQPDPLLLVSSSIARRLFIAHASTAAKSEKTLPIKVALCIQRYAHLSPEMNQLEKDYSNLLTQLETEHSYLSDHELRHKAEK